MKKFAALTQVRNEEFLLPIWLEYYSKHFSHIYVSRHGGERDYIEKCREKYRFTLFEVENEAEFEHMAMVERVGEIIKDLLLDYDYVLYADVDEFIIPDPEKYKGLKEYMRTVKGDRVICTGWEILMVEGESEIDWSKKILAQRQFWWSHSAEWKPAITQVECTYSPGFHYTKEMLPEWEKEGLGITEYIKKHADPDLCMVHINQIDRGLYTSRGRHKDGEGFGRGKDDKTEIPERFKKVL